MSKRKLSRKLKHRRQMLKNLVTNIIIYEKVKTTAAKAKEAKSLIDKTINLAKKPTLASKRKLLTFFLHNKNTVNKLIKEIAPRYEDQSSGYTKLYKTNPRLGDNSSNVIIILARSKFLNNLHESKNDSKILVKAKNNKINEKNDKTNK